VKILDWLYNMIVECEELRKKIQSIELPNCPSAEGDLGRVSASAVANNLMTHYWGAWEAPDGDLEQRVVLESWGYRDINELRGDFRALVVDLRGEMGEEKWQGWFGESVEDMGIE
jgi:hypothetical protein